MAKQGAATVVPRLRFPRFRDAPAWKWKTLSHVCDMQAGKFISASEISEWPDEGAYPCYGGNGLRGYTTTFTHSGKFPLIGRQGALCGNVQFAQGDFYATEHALVSSPKLGIDVDWLCYTLDGLKLNRFATGQAQPGLSVDVLKGVPCAVPADEVEQQKIADCLTSLDEVIAAQGRKVEALKSHKRGLMQQLFPREGETRPRLRFPEFTDAPEWEEPTIQELIDRQFIVGHLDGNHGEMYPRSDEFASEGIPYITANDFKDGVVHFDSCKRLPMVRSRKFKKGVARDGDILFAHNATVGPVAKLRTHYEFVILSTTATYFRCDETKLAGDFLLCAMASPSFVAQYTRVMAQSTRNQVPITTQRKFSLSIPKLPEQQRIADCLSSLDTTITTETNQLAALKTHEQGLMQQLFPAPEADAA